MTQVTTEAFSDSPHEKEGKRTSQEECGKADRGGSPAAVWTLWFMGADITLVLPEELGSSSRRAG